MCKIKPATLKQIHELMQEGNNKGGNSYFSLELDDYQLVITPGQLKKSDNTGRYVDGCNIKIMKDSDIFCNRVRVLYNPNFNKFRAEFEQKTLDIFAAWDNIYTKWLHKYFGRNLIDLERFSIPFSNTDFLNTNKYHSVFRMTVAYKGPTMKYGWYALLNICKFKLFENNCIERCTVSILDNKDEHDTFKYQRAVHVATKRSSQEDFVFASEYTTMLNGAKTVFKESLKEFRKMYPLVHRY